MAGEIHKWKCSVCNTCLRPDFTSLKDINGSKKVQSKDNCPTCKVKVVVEPELGS